MSGEPDDDFDEFGMLGDNAAEAGLKLSALPAVTRTSFTLDGAPAVSALAWRNAEAVAAVIEQAAPAAKAIVGMSLGGATAIRLAATRPDLVRRAVIIDVTPNSGVRSRALAPWRYDLFGPPDQRFHSLAARTVAADEAGAGAVESDN